MKSMKRMLSLLLVALLLVSAIPFAVAAEEVKTDAGTARTFNIEYRIHFVGEYTPVTVSIPNFPSTVSVVVLANDPDPSAIKSAALESCSAESAKTFIAQLGFAQHGRQAIDYTLGNLDVTFENDTVIYTLPVTKNPKTTVETDVVDANILEKVGSSYVSNGKTIPVEIVKTITKNPDTTTVTVTKWKTGAEIKAKYAVAFDGKTVTVDRTYVENNIPYICISTSASTPSGGESLGGGGSTTPTTPATPTTPTTPTTPGTGTVAKFTVRFLNVYGVEFYNEEVTNGNHVTATAEFLNSSVGSRDGYTHIGWRVGSGSTKATSVVVNEKIYNNVTYTPVFTNASGAVVTPPGTSTGSGSTGVGSDGTIGSNPSTSGTNKFQHVYLNIYKDTMIGSADKRVEITNGIAADKWVSLDEVKSVVKNYYTAKTSSDGISYDGLYLEGRWTADYVADRKYSTVDLRYSQDDNVFINVMISNAKVKSSSTADTSNPKTGDSIYAPIAVLGISATALAAVMYVYSKKRLAR